MTKMCEAGAACRKARSNVAVRRFFIYLKVRILPGDHCSDIRPRINQHIADVESVPIARLRPEFVSSFFGELHSAFNAHELLHRRLDGRHLAHYCRRLSTIVWFGAGQESARRSAGTLHELQLNARHYAFKNKISTFYVPSRKFLPVLFWMSVYL